ncbi:MAG: hypothetical protein K2X38_20465 [Gemmataceae bacterium]|nr:hypothetical protein [Gemmataceae bacterium]
MNAALREMAKKAESRPFYLAASLRLYMDSEGMNEAALAKALGCKEDTLAEVRLCRAPRGEANEFQSDVDRIAAQFAIHATVLAEACRRGEVLRKMRESTTTDAGAYMAARDQEDPV